MQGEDGLDDARDAGGRAAKSAEQAPGLEGGDGRFGEGADLGVGSVYGLLAGGERLPSAAERDPDGAVGALVPPVRPAGDAGLVEGVDDAVFAGCPYVVDGSWQCGRGPQQPAERIGDDLTFMTCFLCLMPE